MIYQEKIFTEEECNKIINYCNIYKTTYGCFNTQQITIVDNRLIANNGKVSYNVYVIPNNKNTEWFFNKLLNWFSLQSEIKLNTNNKIPKCTLHCYSNGDSFPKHVDLDKRFKTRRYNLGIQLNDSYEGGEYVCWDGNNDEVLISKQTGTALSYHCKVPHEIKKITKGERWSIVMPITEFEIIEKKTFI
jgi:hypothetical protein